MRRVPVLLPLLALVAPVVLLVGPPAQADELASYAFLPAQVYGAVAVGMPDERTLQVQHRDAATGTWDAPTTIYRARGAVTCGAFDGRAAGTGVALLLECDTPYYEDEAPVHSVALVSTDGYGWAHKTLPGEAYRAPAISASATYAAWLTGDNGEYLAWSAATGFGKPVQSSYHYDQGEETVVADDSGTVTVIGPEEQGRHCVVGIHATTPAGARSATTLPADPGCTEGDTENVDQLTVLTGGDERATQFTVGRAAVGAPWAVTAAAPSTRPGLVTYGYARKRIATHFVYSTATGSPIAALGSPDRHQVLAQRFDAATQTWGPQTLVHTSGPRCQQSYLPQPDTALYVDTLYCAKRYVVLVSPDATTWTPRDIGQRPLVVTPAGAALSTASGTTVVSTSGVQEFPVTTGGRCDLVQAGQPGELVRLHGSRHGWPTKVQVSTGGAFRTVSRVRRVRDVCTEVLVQEGGTIGFNGRHHAKAGRLVLRGGVWRFHYERQR